MVIENIDYFLYWLYCSLHCIVMKNHKITIPQM